VKPAKLVLLTDTLRSLYEQMLRIRRAEERLVKSFHEGLIPGPFHSSLGQEAVAVGVCHHLRADDAVFGTHRGQGHAIAKGVDMTALFAEIYGREDGCCGGRAGPSFFASPRQGFVGAGIAPGTSVQLAVGAATAFQTLGSDQVAVAPLGDGAARSGTFFESAHLAADWKLPVVLICERNQFAGRRAAQGAGSGPAGAAARYFEIPGFEVDGNDVTMVYAAAFEGVRHAREGKGPMIVECATLRWRPFSESDMPSRPVEAGGPADTIDPLVMLADRLVDHHGAVSAELAEWDKRIRKEVDDSHRAAASSPWPSAATDEADSGDDRHA